MNSWEKHEKDRLARQSREVAKRVAQYREKITADLIRMRQGNPSPWERMAIKRVLDERGVL